MVYSTANDDNYDDTDESLETVELSDELSEALNYYDTAVEAGGLTAVAGKWYSSQGAEDFCSDLVNELEADTGAFVRIFQSIVQSTECTYTLEELMLHAPIQMQRGLNPSVISKIIADPNTGLIKNPSLLFKPQVCRLPNGDLRLIGGNHRIAAIYLLLVRGGADVDTICATEVSCEQYSIDMEALTLSMTAYTEDGTPVPPKRADVIKEANRLAFLLWVGSNQSRSMPAGEVKDAEAFSSGVDRNDSAAIIEAAFGAVKLISVPDALRMLARLAAIDSRPPLTDDSGNKLHMPNAVPVLFDILGQSSPLQNTTFEAILKSFTSALAKFDSQHMRTNSRTGEVRPYSHKLWAKDMKDSDRVEDIAKLLFKGTMFEDTINGVLNSLAPDDTYRGNVARNASKIGAALAESFNASYDPLYAYEEPTSKGKAAAKTTVKAKVRRTLAI